MYTDSIGLNLLCAHTLILGMHPAQCTRQLETKLVSVINIDLQLGLWEEDGSHPVFIIAQKQSELHSHEKSSLYVLSIH